MKPGAHHSPSDPGYQAAPDPTARGRPVDCILDLLIVRNFRATVLQFSGTAGILLLVLVSDFALTVSIGDSCHRRATYQQNLWLTRRLRLWAPFQRSLSEPVRGGAHAHVSATKRRFDPFKNGQKLGGAVAAGAADTCKTLIIWLFRPICLVPPRRTWRLMTGARIMGQPLLATECGPNSRAVMCTSSRASLFASQGRFWSRL